KVFDQKDNTQDSSKNTKFAKQPNVEILPKIGETNVLSKPVTSNSVSTPQVSKGMNNAKVIAPGIFRISQDKISREAKHVPNTVSTSSRTKLITISQPNVIIKKNVNSDLNGLSSTGLDNTKTRRPHPRSNTKNDRVPFASKSSRSKNKEVKVEEHHRNLLLSKKNKHSSSACNNSKIDSQDVISKNETQQKNQPEIKKPKKVGFIRRLATPKPRKPRFLLRWAPTGKMFDQDGKLVAPSGDNACTSNTMKPKIKRFPNSTSLLGKLSIFVCGASIQDVKSKVVCAKCKKCLNSVNHDVCLNNCVNGNKSCGRKHKANISKNETQKEYRPKVSKSKNVRPHESLATPKPRKPRFLLRWSPTGKMFDSAGKIIAPSGDNACTSNTMEPKIKRFPNSTSLLSRLSRFVYGASTQIVPST
nr:hypothetical protein [Tanacetum cinerariifolium]